MLDPSYVRDHGEIVLCAELPTESLDYAEFADTVERMVGYASRYRNAFISV